MLLFSNHSFSSMSHLNLPPTPQKNKHSQSTSHYAHVLTLVRPPRCRTCWEKCINLDLNERLESLETYLASWIEKWICFSVFFSVDVNNVQALQFAWRSMNNQICLWKDKKSTLHPEQAGDHVDRSFFFPWAAFSKPKRPNCRLNMISRGKHPLRLKIKARLDPVCLLLLFY